MYTVYSVYWHQTVHVYNVHSTLIWCDVCCVLCTVHYVLEIFPGYCVVCFVHTVCHCVLGLCAVYCAHRVLGLCPALATVCVCYVLCTTWPCPDYFVLGLNLILSRVWVLKYRVHLYICSIHWNNMYYVGTMSNDTM